jgi:uncharacterized protein YneF (UPF0154 family)
MLRYIAWIILIYIAAKILGTLLRFVRPFFQPKLKPEPPVKEKMTKQQFDNIQDADFEDITDKK